MDSKTQIVRTESTTALEEVLKLFCSQEQFRPVAMKPFVVGEYTYATDFYTLVRCESSAIDFLFENKEKPLGVSRAISEINTSEIIDVDSIQWDKFLTKDETVGDGNELRCGCCHGEGTKEYEFTYKNKNYEAEFECPVCKGCGLEQEEKQVPTGNKTFADGSIVKFKEMFFNAKYFYKLKKVKDLLGSEVHLIGYNPQKHQVLFKIGIVTVVIMPVFHEGENQNVIATVNVKQ